MEERPTLKGVGQGFSSMTLCSVGRGRADLSLCSILSGPFLMGLVPNCPVCGHSLAVFLTKKSRSVVNCSSCSVRVFSIGRESMPRLKDTMSSIEGGASL